MKASKFRLLGLMVCFAAASMAVSCNKDNNENGSSNAGIVGTWGCVGGTVHLWGNDPVTMEPVSDTIIPSSSYRGAIVTFNDDRTYTSSDFWVFDASGHWMKDGNTLYVDETDCEIVALDNTTLKLSYDEGWQGYHELWTFELKRQ